MQKIIDFFRGVAIIAVLLYVLKVLLYALMGW